MKNLEIVANIGLNNDQKKGRVTKLRGDSIMLWGCLFAGSYGKFHKIDGFMRKEYNVDILKQSLKTIRKLQMNLSNGQ